MKWLCCSKIQTARLQLPLDDWAVLAVISSTSTCCGGWICHNHSGGICKQIFSVSLNFERKPSWQLKKGAFEDIHSSSYLSTFFLEGRPVCCTNNLPNDGAWKVSNEATFSCSTRHFLENLLPCKVRNLPPCSLLFLSPAEEENISLSPGVIADKGNTWFPLW